MTYTVAEYRFAGCTWWCVLNAGGRIVEHHPDAATAVEAVRELLILTGGKR